MGHRPAGPVQIALSCLRKHLHDRNRSQPQTRSSRALAPGCGGHRPGGFGACQLSLLTSAVAADVSRLHESVQPDLLRVGLADEHFLCGVRYRSGIGRVFGRSPGGTSRAVLCLDAVGGGLPVGGARAGLHRPDGGGGLSGLGQLFLPSGGLHHLEPAGVCAATGLCLQRAWADGQPGLGRGAGVHGGLERVVGLARGLPMRGLALSEHSGPGTVAARRFEHTSASCRTRHSPTGQCPGFHEGAGGLVVLCFLHAVHHDPGHRADLWRVHPAKDARRQFYGRQHDAHRLHVVRCRGHVRGRLCGRALACAK